MTPLKQIELAQFDVTSGPITTRPPGQLAIRDAIGRATVVGSHSTQACAQFRYLGQTDQLVPAKSGRYLHQIGLMIRHADQCNLIYLTWRLMPTAELILQVKRNENTSSNCGGRGYHVIARIDYPAFAIGEMHEVMVRVDAQDDGSAIATAWADWQQVLQAVIPADLLEGIDGAPGFRSDNGCYDFRFFVAEE